MVQIEQIAAAALRRDSLLLRSLTQDLLAEKPRLSDYPRPQTDDPRLLAAAASFLELLAHRLQQEPPAWTEEIAPLPEPFYLLAATASMKRLRVLCETQSPEPLRRRNLFAPPNFLEFA